MNLNQYSPKTLAWIKYTERCPTPLISREKPIKTIMSYTLHTLQLLKLNSKYW